MSRLLYIVSALLLLAHCNHAPPAEGDDEPDYALSDTAKQVNFTACQNSSLYTCVSEIYGKDLQTLSEEGDFTCVTFSDGATICPSGTAYTFNSAPFEHACSQSDDCNIRYNTLLYKCRANIPGPGGDQSKPTREIDRALRQAYDNCIEALERKKD